jgi:hypothetical protein
VTTQDDHNIHAAYTAHDDRNKHGSSNYLYLLRFQLPWCLRGAIDIVKIFIVIKAVMIIKSLNVVSKRAAKASELQSPAPFYTFASL